MDKRRIDPAIVVPIRNIPQVPASLKEFPADIEHARHKRGRRLNALETDIRRLRDQIRFKDRVLQDEIDMWTLGLGRGEWETVGQVTRRISRLKGARDYQGYGE